jgi:hypothetical protein
MLDIYKIAILNINGKATYTKISKPGDFLKQQNIDTALLQDATHNDFTNIHEYNAIVNEGTDKRGTAILVKAGLQIHQMHTIGMGYFSDVSGYMDNYIYAPSSAEKRVEGEYFFNTDITFLLNTDSIEVLIAGEFNCVISQADCTGKPNMSRALTTLMRGMGLCVLLTTHSHIPAYTITQLLKRQERSGNSR